jgi:hypothetical protein
VRNTKRGALELGAVHAPNQVNVDCLGQLDGNKFYYPAGVRQTKANVEAKTSAEENLSVF